MIPAADKAAFFSQLIRTWMAAGHGRNLYALARSSGLSYSNLRAIEAGKSDVTLNTALRLLQHIQPDSATTQAILKLFPDLAATLGYLAQPRTRQESYRHLSPKACRAAVEIYGRRRMACELLHDLLGPGAAAFVDELQQLDLITMDAEYYRPAHAFFPFTSPDILLSFLRLFLDNVHHDLAWNLVAARFSGLKAEAAAEVQSILEDARLRVMVIQEKPENAGDLNVAWGLVMTRF